MAKLSEYYSSPPAIPDSLWSLLDNSSKEHAKDRALTVMHQPTDHLSHLRSPSSSVLPNHAICLQWTFADLRHASLLMAQGLDARGVQRGSTIATLIFNGVECVLLHWVSAILQLTLAPLDARLLDAGREEQLRDYMGRLKPAVLVVPDKPGAETVDAALEATDIRPVLRIALASMSPTNDSQWEPLATLASSEICECEAMKAVLNQDRTLDDLERVAMVLFTSGTSTGKPKGCPRTVRNLLSSNAGEFGMSGRPRRAVLHTPNSGAISQCFLLWLGSIGSEMIIPAPVFSPAGALEAIEKYGAEFMVAIPVMSRMFEKEMAAQRRDLSSIKEVAIGGDMVTSEAKEKFERLFPSARVVIGHGMSEAVSLIGSRGHGPFMPEYHNILATGYAQPGANLRICDETGKVVALGEAGELHVGGPYVIERYLEDAQPEAFCHDERGNWLLTGDRAMMGEDGAIFIVGRIKDIIKRVGVSMSPAVVESVLNRLDGVEAAVFGIPSADYGEVPVAIVKDLETVKEAEIKDVVVRSLGADYSLEDIRTLSDLGFETWPLNQTGKVMKHELKSAYLARFRGA